MTKRFAKSLRQSVAGVSTIEFAILAPVLLIFIFGLFQMGKLYHEYSVVRSAVSEGARYATIYPRPTTAQIAERIRSRHPTLASASVVQSSITFSTETSTGEDVVDISMRYNTQLNLVMLPSYPITLAYTLRAYVPPTS
jgi:Flp pilus assembly protein TadG